MLPHRPYSSYTKSLALCDNMPRSHSGSLTYIFLYNYINIDILIQAVHGMMRVAPYSVPK